MLADIVFNILFLLMIIVVYSTYPFKNHKKLFTNTPLVGLVIGLLGILTMAFPVVFEQGVQFDSRSIIEESLR